MALVITDSIFADIELIYEPGEENGSWTGYAVILPLMRIAGSSIHQVDMKLTPLLTDALEQHYGEPVSINILPGGEKPLGDGRWHKTARKGPGNMPCSITILI